DGRPDLLYVDLHLVHEVTSPQAFEGLRLAGRRVPRTDLTVATMDHDVPPGDSTHVDPLAQQQLEPLRRNSADVVVAPPATGIGRIGVDGGVGHVVEYAGPAIAELSMEGRMTICNMSIEAGARAGLIAPDKTTFAYLRDRDVPFDDRWRDLRSDDDAVFDRE